MNRRFRWNDAPVGRVRASDASAGGPGERGAPTAGGINPEKETFDTNRRRIHLRGRDQETGEHFGAELYFAAAKERAPRMLIDRLLGHQAEEGPSVEEASAALASATEVAEAADRARVLVLAEERAAEQDIELAVVRRDVALSGVLRTAPELTALWDRYQAARQSVWDIAWTLSAVGVHRLPREFHWDGLVQGADRGCGAVWKAAIAALETDPDAELPSA
jgi:hypothetical protein